MLASWRKSGGFGIDGLDLLVWQAIGQLEVMGFDSKAVQSNRLDLYHRMRTSALQSLGL
jgi:shikimate 5-dehydrogenase